LYSTTTNNILGKRNAGIDIMRGACILAVILLHLNIHFGFVKTFLGDILSKKLFALLFWSGFYGVVIFFTLSGYLITNSILTKWGTLNKIDLKTFYWFRFSRIIPPLALLLIVLSVLHLTGVQGFVIDSKQTSLVRVVFSALTFHINWLEIQVGYLPANWDILWSISIEETFYLVFPLLCLLITRDWHLAIVLTLFLVVSPWARTSLYPGNELGDKNHLAFIDAIVLGCMTAIIAARVSFSDWRNKVFLLLGTFLMILILFFRSFVYHSGITGIGLNVTILSVGVSFLLLALRKSHSERPGYFSVFKWLEQMGLYSYEIYLTHMFVVIIGVKIYSHWELDEQWLIPFSLVIILFSYLVGRLVFLYFSEPMNLWLRKKWIEKKRLVVKDD